MKNWILCFFMLSIFISYGQANKVDAKRFVEISGVDNRYDEIIQRVINQVGESKREDLKKDLTFFKNKMSEEMVNYYSTKFSQSEIDALIEFYNSPLGKKLVESKAQFHVEFEKKDKEFQNEISRLIMKYMY
ncbi:MAG TPA: DUF2059 domain-containing protein [Flavobacterium sp.]|nr:DUF2059 domain-containing protein [Flavobacterium sp.]